MQVFLFGALAVSLIVVLFALQNIVPVSVAFLGWTFQGSLALVLFLAFVVGALASFLASIPAMVKDRWSSGQHRKEMAALQASLAECEHKLQEAGVLSRPEGSQPRPSPPSSKPPQTAP